MWMKLLLNKKVLIGVGILLVILFIYFSGKKSGKDKNRKPPKPAPLPNNGQGIPQGWSPSGPAIRLHSAMEGWGTDYEAIWNALTGLTNDQLAAVKNEFDRRFHQEGDGDLFEWFEDDMSGDNLGRAMGYFKFMR